MQRALFPELRVVPVGISRNRVPTRVVPSRHVRIQSAADNADAVISGEWPATW